jgi:hypothetical protein
MRMILSSVYSASWTGSSTTCAARLTTDDRWGIILVNVNVKLDEVQPQKLFDHLILALLVLELGLFPSFHQKRLLIL